VRGDGGSSHVRVHGSIHHFASVWTERPSSHFSGPENAEGLRLGDVRGRGRSYSSELCLLVHSHMGSSGINVASICSVPQPRSPSLLVLDIVAGVLFSGCDTSCTGPLDITAQMGSFTIDTCRWDMCLGPSGRPAGPWGRGIRSCPLRGCARLFSAGIAGRSAGTTQRLKLRRGGFGTRVLGRRSRRTFERVWLRSIFGMGFRRLRGRDGAGGVGFFGRRSSLRNQRRLPSRLLGAVCWMPGRWLRL
jgi:hypothetical protein